LLPKQMCHAVTSSTKSADDLLVTSPSADLMTSSKRLFIRSAAEDPWAFLRRHYLSRHRSFERKSRNFADVVNEVNTTPSTTTTTTTTTTAKPLMRQVCKMVPEQRCEKKRVNPKLVIKQMVKKICRKPRQNSRFDNVLVERIKQMQMQQLQQNGP
jgi:hypothetical protein